MKRKREVWIVDPLVRRLSKIINPIYRDSTFHLTWNAIIFLFILWNAFFIPLRFAFRKLWNDQTTLNYLYIVDYLGDLFFLIDIILNFRLTYLKRGICISDGKKMAQQYLKQEFILDCLASIPIDFIRYCNLKSNKPKASLVRIS